MKIIKRMNEVKYGILLPLFLIYAPAQAQTQFPSDAKQSCVVSSDEFKKWITLDSIKSAKKAVGPVYDEETGQVYIFPPDGPNFSTTSTDCDFYKWGSRMFLWLSSTVTDTFTKPENTQLPDSETNYVFSSEFFYQLEENKKGQQILAAQGPEKSSIKSIRHLKPVDAEENAQAGGSGVLISQDKNLISKEPSLVYYSVNTNRVYGYFLNAFDPDTKSEFPDNALEVCFNIGYGLVKGYAKFSGISATLFLNYCDPFLTDKRISSLQEQIVEKASTLGIDLDIDLSTLNLDLEGKKEYIIPSLETAIDYLAMTVEMKTSWVRADTLQHPERYIRQTAKIYNYDKISDSLWPRKGVSEQPVELAMVGMHVVGTVKGHPEMIWATIEHVDNAPNSSYPYLDKNNATKFTSDTSKEAKGNWLFSDGTALTSITENSQILSKEQKSGNGKAGDIAALSGQTIGPVNVNRLVPWGNPNSQNAGIDRSADLNAQIISMNQSVLSNLKDELSSDPRANYFLSGATWSKGGQIPVTGTEEFITGSTLLANTTMETFHQDKNCFSCHSEFKDSNGKPNPPVSISHLFQSLQKTLPLAD